MNADQSVCARCGRTILRGLEHWFAVGTNGYACGTSDQHHVSGGAR